MQELPGLRCLDLFAGTGALGLEALSRGAAHVQFVEAHAATARQLQTNLRLLDADPREYALAQCDALSWLQSTPAQPFDLVFLDPPFAQDLWQSACAQLTEPGYLAEEALIYVESPKETKIETPSDWFELKSLQAGAVSARLFRRNAAMSR